MGFLKNIWEKFRSLKTWQKIVVVLIVLSVIRAAGGSASSSTPPSSSSTPSASATPKASKAVIPSGPAIGSSASGEKFTFVVWKINCTKKTVSGALGSSTAQGYYCILNASIKNTGKEAQTVFSSYMKLIDDKGREFKTDDMAQMNTGQTDLWPKEINPGNQIDGQLIFDVPTDAKIVTAEMHDSAFSGGVKIDPTRKDPACKEKLFSFVAIQFGESLALAKSGKIPVTETKLKETRTTIVNFFIIGSSFTSLMYSTHAILPMLCPGIRSS